MSSTHSSESSFVTPVLSDTEGFSEFLPIGRESETYIYYKVCYQGKYYFMKQLRLGCPSEAYHRAALRKEYELGTQLHSDYIVRYLQLVDTAEECYVLLDYVSGTTLSELLLFHPDHFRKSANLGKFLSQICQALQELHSHQALHLDLKPSNIMLTSVNNDVRLIDLGCSYMDARPYTTGHTSRFAAPEQLDGSNDLDARTDIYSLGRVLIEMGGAGLPSPFRRIADRCTREFKSDRYQSVDEILLAMNRSRRRFWAVAATFVLIALIGAGTCYHQANREYVLRDSVFFYGKSDDMLRLRVLSVEDHTAAVISSPGDRPYHNDLIIPDSVVHEDHVYYVTELADSAFFHCSELSGIKLPSRLQRIGFDAFNGCSMIPAIHYPMTLREVMMGAFIDCKGLKHINWPSSVAEVPRNCFLACKSLKRIVLPEGVTTIRQDAFCDCDSLVDVSLPSSLTQIERGVFFLCKSLQTVTLPENVESLGEYLFYKCPSLQEIRVLATKPPFISTIVDGRFRGVVRVPSSSIEAYRSAPGWQDLHLEAL
jgi:serine/threonine protein kinase